MLTDSKAHRINQSIPNGNSPITSQISGRNISKVHFRGRDHVISVERVFPGSYYAYPCNDNW